MSRATRKRRLLNPQKCQLRFVDQPRSGSRHDYGPRLQSGVNARSFISEPTRHGVPAHPWVSPQFSSLEATCGQNKRRKKSQLPASISNRTPLSTQVRRSAVCRYPALLFETSNSVAPRRRRGLGIKSTASHVGDSGTWQGRRPPGGHGDGTGSSTSLNTGVHDHARRSKAPELGGGKLATPSSVCTRTPELSSTFTPPRLETPEMPHPHPSASPLPLSLLFNQNQPQTPPRTENLLVRDTPESDYGLKVTWRRRKKLMRLLTERGHLLHTDVMISSQTPESGSSAPAALFCLPVAHDSGLQLDSAIDHFIIRNDFHGAFEACERGLESLAQADEHEQHCSRHGELKAAFCIVGVQALAELNQWKDVLTWVSQHYGGTEQIPAKIMQMCILLYTKVAEQAAVQEAVRSWLRCSSNVSLPGYSSVAELYVLHVLLPLRRTAEAKDLLMDEVGQDAFTEDQRRTALTILESHDANAINPSYPSPELVPGKAEKKITPQGSVVRKLNAVMRLLYRGLSLAGVTARSRFIHRTAVLLLLLYLLLVRMDPALPSAYPWILRLYGLWRQMWNAIFGPYYKTST